MAGDADLVFLPWVRRGAAAAIQSPDRFGADQPGSATATLALEVNFRPAATVPVTVMGPGHVTGIDRRQVVRTDPPPGATNFEPNYMPLVEFDEPSLPWLFTPAAAGEKDRLRPWLCLVVVRPQPGVSLGPPRLGPLPVLRIDPPADLAAELPDLADCWAWAHGQIAAFSGGSEQDLLAALAANPERCVARLLCPRILAPDTEYLACVVPTFALGRKAGLGETITAADEGRLDPAWEHTDTSVELPVYHSWNFATGAGGDFQSLALLLRARPLPEGVGTTPIDIGESGLASGLPAGTVMPLAGALRPIGSADTPAPPPAWVEALTPVLNAAAAVTEGADPLLAPPLYGAAQAGLAQVDPARVGRWFETLNLSPVHRATARLGTRVVQEQQDALMASAWAQAAELERVNRLLRQSQLGCWVAASMHRRHIATMEPDVGLQVLAPAQARMLRSEAPGNRLAALILDTGLPRSVFGAALRRVIRPRGAISRRLERNGATPTPTLLPRTVSILRSLQPMQVMARWVAVPVPLVSLERVAAGLPTPRTDITWGEATAEAVAALPGRPAFAFVAIGAHVPLTPRPPRRPRPTRPQRQTLPLASPVRRPILRPLRPIGDGPFEPPDPEGPPPIDPDPDTPKPLPLVDNAAAQHFRSLAAAHLARVNPPFVTAARGPVRQGLLSEAFNEAVARSAPRETFAARARASLEIPGPDRSESRAFERVGLAPAFRQPMVEQLAEIAQDLLLPGLDLVPPNTVVPLETNSDFVEAYMAGLNTEMGRELVWRGFPADLSATYFDRFWDASSAPGRPPDIPPIATWGTRELGASGGTESFVLLVRSELLRRYPDAAIYAVQGGEERLPIFAGGFPPDIRYVGFDIPATEIRDWSIVIQEHPFAPRFGIEADEDTAGAAHLRPRGDNAASVARNLRQMPVQVTLPTSILLGPA